MTVVTPEHDHPPLEHTQLPATCAVVPSHCLAMVGPEHTWPMPHCVPSTIVAPHAGHWPQSHFPPLHVHVVRAFGFSRSVHVGGTPHAVAPAVVHESPPLTGLGHPPSAPPSPVLGVVLHAIAKALNKSHFML